MSETEVKEKIRNEIVKAIQDGFITFISGMARGIDIWAAEIVLQEKKNNPHIKLLCAVPYNGFEKSWSESEKNNYNNIIENADYVKFVCEHYSRQCFQIRNVYMVDLSERVIAAYNGIAGGTRNTIKYAEKKNVEVVNVLI